MVRVEWTVSSSLHNGVSQCVLGPPVCRSVGPAVHSTHMRDCLLVVLPQERDGPTTTRSFAGGGALQFLVFSNYFFDVLFPLNKIV
jgi:hypothetical protein